ncbi:hypothetical protein MMC18_000080 [Xylographa bjoerkii]|nr:hypothetical protein [Xylographa bjoerkii]
MESQKREIADKTLPATSTPMIAAETAVEAKQHSGTEDVTVNSSGSRSPEYRYEEGNPDQYGFLVYRTTYGDQRRWEDMKQKLNITIRASAEAIREYDGDPDTAVLHYVEDERTLQEVTSKQIRTIFNPLYDPSDEDRPSPALRPDHLCSHVCLMIDTPAMESILAHTTEKPGYVIAVDANNEESEKWTLDLNADGTLAEVTVPWDGTMMVDVTSIFTEFYRWGVGDDSQTMGGIHKEAGRVWSHY